MECSICLGEIRKTVLLDCGHIFCRHCIQTWSRKSLQCPYCRQQFELTAIMDNEFKEGWNAISFAGHAHMIHVEETALDNGETIQLITSHKFSYRNMWDAQVPILFFNYRCTQTAGRV